MSTDANYISFSWTYSDNVKVAEICLCGAGNCRAFIAKLSPTVMERSIKYHEQKLQMLEAHNSSEVTRLTALQSLLGEKGHVFTAEEREQVRTIRKDHKQLRLTFRRFLVLKKGLQGARTQLREETKKVMIKSLSPKSVSMISFSTISCNPNEKLEDRLVRAVENERVPLSIKLPFPLELNETYYLLPQNTADNLIVTLKSRCKPPSEPLLLKAVRISAKILARPIQATLSHFVPRILRRRDDEYPHARVPIALCGNLETESDNEDDNTGEAMPHLKDIAEKARLFSDVQRSETPQVGAPEEPGDWGEGLLTRDEIARVLSWCTGTIHARGAGRSVQPWPNADEWAFWLHENTHRPDYLQRLTHAKSWTGISTKTLRAKGLDGKVTLPSALQVKTLLSDVLTFVPFKFAVEHPHPLIRSKKLGYVWRLVWAYDPMPPGNPRNRTTG